MTDTSFAPNTTPAQNNDPCAGKKGAINPNTQGGLKAGINHLSARHIDPQESKYRRGSKDEKSVFDFGSLFTKGQASLTKPQKEGIVLGIMQEAFEKGAANKLTGGDYAYSYAPFATLGGVVSADFIGRDQMHGYDFTNVRTVVLNITDCGNPTLVTGFPGLMTNAPNVNGTPSWKPVNAIIR